MVRCHPQISYTVLTLTWVMGSRWLPLGIGIAPALRRVLMWRGTTGTAGEERGSRESWLKSVIWKSLPHLKLGLTKVKCRAVSQGTYQTS